MCFLTLQTALVIETDKREKILASSFSCRKKKSHLQETAARAHFLLFSLLDVATRSLSQYVMLLYTGVVVTCQLINSRQEEYLGCLKMFCDLVCFF